MALSRLMPSPCSGRSSSTVLRSSSSCAAVSLGFVGLKVPLNHKAPPPRRPANARPSTSQAHDGMLQVDVGSAGVAMAAVGSAAVVAAGAATGWPQFPQKRSFSASVAWQCGHCIVFVLRRSGAFQCLRPRQDGPAHYPARRHRNAGNSSNAPNGRRPCCTGAGVGWSIPLSGGHDR